MSIEEFLQALNEGKVITTTSRLFGDQRYLYSDGNNFVVVDDIGDYIEAKELLPFHGWLSEMLGENQYVIGEYHPPKKRKSEDYYFQKWVSYANRFIDTGELSLVRSAPYGIRLRYDFCFAPPRIRISVNGFFIKTIKHDNHYLTWVAFVELAESNLDFEDA